MAPKFKVCPACGEHNPPVLLECKKCEADLTGIKVIDEALLATANVSVSGAPASIDNGSLVKKCDCGTENPSQARKCSSCGEDISDVRATTAHTAPQKMIKIVLRSVDYGFSFTLDKPITIIGREAEMQEYLKAKTYVSRKHSKIILINGEIYIENLSSTNRTFINNTLISSDAPTLLKNGDEIGLGGKLIDGERQNQAAYLVIEVAT